MAGIQMEFDSDIGENYKIFYVDDYKIGVENNLIKKEKYLEIKYSDNFLMKGLYVSKIKPESNL